MRDPKPRVQGHSTGLSASHQAHGSRGGGAALALAAAAAVCATLAHGSALSARARCFDDQQYLLENHLVQNPGLASAWQFLREVLAPSTVGGYYQPLAMISLMCDYAMAGSTENLMPFHRTSLLLHAANTALIVLLLHSMTRRPWIAGAVGLLFGVHPLGVEVIPWIGERKTTLAAFFALTSLNLYVRFAATSRRAPYVGSLVAYILALLSKPTATPLPAVLLLMDVWPLKRLSRRAVLEKVPFALIGLISSIVTFVSQKTTAGASMPTEHPIGRIPLVLCHNIVFYLSKMVWPSGLSPHYPFPDPLDLSQPRVLAGVVGTLLLTAALLVSLRCTRAFLAGWLMFFIMILPTMQIIGFSNVIASDKFAYLPSVGLLILLAFCLAKLVPPALAPPRPSVPEIATLALAAALALPLGLATRRYLAVWQDTESLCRHMLKSAPRAYPVHNDLAAVLLEKGKLDESIHHARTAVQLEPGDPLARTTLALALSKKGDREGAIREYARAIAIKPNDTNARSNLGNLLLSQGQVDSAIEQYKIAIEGKPTAAETILNLGNALLRKGSPSEALQHYERALRLRPGLVEAHVNIANILASQGRRDEAKSHLEQALRLKPGYAPAHNSLGNILTREGRIDEAIEQFREAIRRDAASAQAQNNLATLLARQNRLEEAARHYADAVSADPAFTAARIGLGEVLRRQGKIDAAIATYEECLRVDPDSALSHYALGRIFEDLARFEDAARHYQQAVRLDPAQNDARRRLEGVIGRAAQTRPSPE